MRKLCITGYHGTDYSFAKDIIKGEFICKNNSKHWLGNGVYLYIDKELAKWWTTQPSENFGSQINTPAIIECSIEIDEEKVLNMCSLEGYKKYVEKFNAFFKEHLYKHRPDKEIDFKIMRALFFNYLLMLDEIDMIIAPFFVPEQPYLPIYENNTYANKMHIKYTEVQICIKTDKQGIIKNKKILDLE